MTSVAAYFSY